MLNKPTIHQTNGKIFMLKNLIPRGEYNFITESFRNYRAELLFHKILK
jgi:hypothetical protein